MSLNNKRQVLAGGSIACLLALTLIIVAFSYFPAQAANVGPGETTTTVTSVSTSNAVSATVNTVNGTSTTQVSIVTDRILFGTQASHQSQTAVIPANTLVWTSYNASSPVYIAGANTQILASPQNYNSNVTLALYVNGKLVGSQTYTIPPATAPPSGNSSQLPKIYQVAFGVYLNSQVSSGSVVSLAILSATPVNMSINSGGPGQTSEAPAASLPTQLPMGASSLSYAPDIYAYSEQ